MRCKARENVADHKAKKVNAVILDVIKNPLPMWTNCVCLPFKTKEGVDHPHLCGHLEATTTYSLYPTPKHNQYIKNPIILSL